MDKQKSQISETLSNNRPERAVQFLLTAAAVAALAYFVIGILSPLYPTMMTLFAFFLITSTVIFFSIEGNNRQQVFDWIRNGFFPKPPNLIDILEDQLNLLHQKLKLTGKEISKMRKQMQQVSRQIQQNKGQINKALEQAENAKSRSNRKDLIISTRKAQRLQQSNQRLEDLFVRMEDISSILSKLYRYADFQYEEYQDQVDLKRTEFELYQSAYKAMKAARDFQSNSHQLNAFMDTFNKDISATIGHLDQTLEEAQNFFDRVDQDADFSVNDAPVLQLPETEDWQRINEKLLQKDQQVLDLDDPETHPDKEKEIDNRYDDYLDNF
ncbi:MAG: hypothetical protein AAF598_06375 [Bacteroidota bacterium]